MAETNMAFARKCGVHFTMASRLRNGHRLPSTSLLIRISKVYHLPLRDLTVAYSDGRDAFGQYMRAHVFENGAS